MSVTVQEINGQLICMKPNHNENIIMVALNDTNPSNQLLCSKCLKSRNEIQNVIGIEQAIQLIQEKSQKSEELKRKHLSILNQISDAMTKKFCEAHVIYDEMARIVTIWKQGLTSKETLLENIIKGIQLLKDDGKDSKIFAITSSTNILLKKEHFLFQKLCKVIQFDSIVSLFQDLNVQRNQNEDSIKKQMHNSNIQSYPDRVIPHSKQQILNPQNQPYISETLVQNNRNIKKIELINSLKQLEWSYAIAFNITGSMMIAGCNSDIKVWKFSLGKLTEQQRLIKHQGDVLCLAFSKKLNLFISGSNDSTIICWKERFNGEWDSNYPLKQHKNIVTCILINQNEDEVISCSWDNTIIVSKLDCQNNNIQYFYTLEEKYSQKICCISFNQSETNLVSCNQTKQVILWVQNKDKKWIYQNEINCQDFGRRISFINDYQIIFQPESQGLVLMYEVIGGKLVRKQEYDLVLGQNSQDVFLFPTIVNYKKNIIIQRYNRFIYILKQQENGFLKVVASPVDCQDSCNFGTLTFDGEFLVIWNNTSQAFKVYKISYKE